MLPRGDIGESSTCGILAHQLAAGGNAAVTGCLASPSGLAGALGSDG